MGLEALLRYAAAERWLIIAVPLTDLFGLLAARARPSRGALALGRILIGRSVALLSLGLGLQLADPCRDGLALESTLRLLELREPILAAT